MPSIIFSKKVEALSIPLKERNQISHTIFMVCMVLSASQALRPFPFVAAFILLCCLAFNSRASGKSYSLVCLIAAVGVITSIFVVIDTSDISLILRMMITSVIFVLTARIEFSAYTSSIDVAIKVIRYSLYLSLVGFIYALLGGSALFSIQNPDGRESLFFLTTLTNSTFPGPGNSTFIRPSFIYDEPGAYAFVIDIFLLASYVLHQKLRKQEWIILVGGFLTFSLAHILVPVVLLISERKTRYLIILVLITAAVDFGLYSAIGYSPILSRLIIENGQISGDNRSELFKNALSLIADFPQGVGNICKWDIFDCVDRFGGFGENPAFPAAYFGLISSIPFYLMLLSILLIALLSIDRRAILIGLAIFGLFSQRPFLFNLGYNLLIVMLFVIYANRYWPKVFKK
jgi:hypothetical protein